MAVSKVIYDGETLVDLTNDTVTPSALAEGVTAHNASGEKIVGTFTIPVATGETAGTMKLYAETGTNTDGTMTQAAITEALANTVNLTANHTFTGINTHSAFNEKLIAYTGTELVLSNNVSVYLWNVDSSAAVIDVDEVVPLENTIRTVSIIITVGTATPFVAINNAGTIVGTMPAMLALATHVVNLLLCSIDGVKYCYVMDGGSL